MESTVTKTVENIDKLFSQITVNGESYNSERYTPPVSVAVSPAPVTTPRVSPEVSPKKTIRATLPVTKTVENIDKLFSQITVNGESYNSERYTPPVSVAVSPAPVTTPKVTQNKTIRATLPVTRSGTNAQAVQGEDVYAVELNDILHNFVDRVVAQGLADEVSARQSADTLLAGFINALNALIPEGASSSNKLVTASQLNVVSASVSDIEDLIPSQASDQNQLADKSFVNSSIATNTANFLGTYTTLADIQAIQNPTNNDYAFLQTTDSAGNTQFDRYKYSSESNQWLYEYTLNNSSFTAEQWATINSGLTASSVSDAIGALDVASVGGSGKYISAISETDGKINATATDLGNMVPVDSVTNNDTHSVTSNRIFKCFGLNNVYNEWYSAGRYSSGFIKLGSVAYTTDGNHDVALCGTSFYCNATNICVMYFTCYIRGRGSTVSVKTFTTHRIGGDNLATLRCTYEISGDTFKINLWGMISSWARFIVKFNGVFSGDVITPSSSVDTSNTVATSMTGTEISATVI